MEETRNKVVNEAEETLGIFEEYRQKFTEAIEKEKKRITEQTEQKSVDIIAAAEQKAQQIIKETIREAENESGRILTRSRELAAQIISEVERFAEVVTKVKQEVEQEIEKATQKIRQEADIVTEATHKAGKAIDETRSRLEKDFEKSIRVITEVGQKLKQVAEVADHGTSEEFEPQGEPVDFVPATTHERKEIIEPTAAEAHNATAREVDDDKLFVGTLELDITPSGDSVSLERLQKRLSQIPGLELLLVNGSADERTKITIFIARPLPLLRALKEMAPVRDAVKNKDGIQVVLQTSDGWLG